MYKLSIIIPAYNEGATICNVVEQLLHLDLPCLYEVVLIDDGSNDSTAEEAEKNKQDNFRVFKNIKNRGYGASIKRGIRMAKGDYVLIFDADGQFMIRDVKVFFDTITTLCVDLVVGERKIGSDSSPLWRKPGKFFIKMLVNYLLNEKIRDINCGFRIFKRDVIIRYLHLCSDKFSFSTSSTIALISRGCGYHFLPIEMNRRQGGKSAVSLKTGFQTIMLVVRLIMLFNPMKIFLPFGLLFIAFGFLWGLNYLILGRGLSIGTLLFFTVGIFSIFFGLIAEQISELRKSQFEK